MPEPVPVQGDSAAPSRPGTCLPEVALLHDLTRWREQLARSIARNNLAMRSGEIAAAVNRIIFSLLFLRIAGDRQLITVGYPESGSADNPGRTLSHVWEAAGDPWACTGEFPGQLHGDREDPVIDERVFKNIIAQLAQQECPSRYSGLTTDMLARVIGQYLGRTIRRSAVHQATVVETQDTVLSGTREGPTPAMTEYLVTSALQAAERERSRREILPLRCIDPACGAGAVLIPLYRHLIEVRAGKHATFAERRDILLDSIHGLDIDLHAVAATKILLLLTLCEGETGSTLPADFFTISQEVFRDLRYTILCGNALIAPDISGDESWSFCPARDRHQLGVFAWAAGFPEIFLAGGFDIVIGNPPEGTLATKEWIQQYFQRHYAVYDPAVDRSAYFVERGLDILRPGGVLGYCTGNQWLRGKAGSPLRSLLGTREIVGIVDLPCTTGNRSGCGTSILTVVNRTPVTPRKFPASIIGPELSGDLREFVNAARFPVDPVQLAEGGWALRDSRVEDLIAKLARAGTPLDDMVMGQVRIGSRAGFDPVFVIGEAEKREIIRKDPRAKTFIRPLVSGPDIGPYRIAESRFALVIPRGWTDVHNTTGSSPWRWFRRRHPAIAGRLKKSGEAASCTGPEGYWWETASAGELTDRHPGILFPSPFRTPAFAFDGGQAIADNAVGVIGSSSLYLAGLLNSRLIAFFLFSSPRRRAGQVFFTGEDLQDLPVYTPELDNPADRARHDRLVALVMRRIDLEKNLQRRRPGQDTGDLEVEIAAIRKKTDALVYELYGLTKEEIAVIEGAASRNDSSS